MAKKLALDELPKRLTVDGKKIDDMQMIYGFVAPGTAENNITFYLDPSLKTSVVINDEDIIDHAKVNKSHNPIGGTVIWVKNAAKYLQGNATQAQAAANTQTQQHAEQFFRGDIYQQYANTVQGNTVPKPQNPYAPVCGCGKCE